MFVRDALHQVIDAAAPGFIGIAAQIDRFVEYDLAGRDIP